MKNLLLIRTDGNARIGTGHVMRCLSLAQGWLQAGGKVLFALADSSSALETRLIAEGTEVVQLVTDLGTDDDAAQTVDLARQRGATLVVADGYHFGAGYQRRIKDGGLQLMVIDDYSHAEHYFADLVLNQNLHANADSYSNREPYTRLLLGVQYALLRRQFLKYRNWQRPIPVVARKVLVTLGGSDPDNVTSEVIKALANLDVETKVAVGGSNPHVEGLRAEIEQLNSAEMFVDTANMPELMAWADLAIAAGGTTSWDLAFMGLPSVTVVLAENQVGIAQGLSEAGAAVNLGWHERISSESMIEKIEQLLTAPEMRRQMSRRGQELVDGDGVTRVISSLEMSRINLRKACADDCRMVWEWANDPDARKRSFVPDPIPWIEHVKWFESKLRDPQCLYFIALGIAGEPIGQARYDFSGEEATLSVSLDAKFRGNGYGSLVIRAASQNAFDLVPISSIHAYIKKDNEPSVRAFAKAGYKEEALTSVQGHEAYRYALVRDGLK
jgi:UDP-2,4-diacetamido-2,4,6-trideoxy-beta-L-altropyranose hydrolase